MPEVLDLKEVVKDIISSYEKRIESISSIFDTSNLIVGDFQKSLLATKEEVEQANNQLRETLAKNGNLRKKDFDNMMQGIFKPQNEREKEMCGLLSNYLNEQKEITLALKDNFTKVRKALAKSENGKIKELLQTIKALIAKQDRKKEEFDRSFEELQKEQQETVTNIKALLVRGEKLRVKDLKEMLAQMKLQHEARIAQKFERREEVRSMLADFKKQRMEKAKEKRAPKKNAAQKVTGSPEANHPHTKDIGKRVDIDVLKDGYEQNSEKQLSENVSNKKKGGD